MSSEFYLSCLEENLMNTKIPKPKIINFTKE